MRLAFFVLSVLLAASLVTSTTMIVSREHHQSRRIERLRDTRNQWRGCYHHHAHPCATRSTHLKENYR